MAVRVAIDIGSTNSRLYYNTPGEQLQIEEAYRFKTKTTTEDGRMVWDFDHLRSETISGLKAVAEETGRIDSISIDATAGDFGLVADGDVLRNPYFCFDPDLYTKTDEILERVSHETIFETTGHVAIPDILYYQYHTEPELFAEADYLLPIPQLLSYTLGGEPVAERSYAITLRIVDAETGTWSNELLDALDIPARVFPEVESPGTQVGTLDPSLSPFGDESTDIYLAPSHDTAAAMAAIPFEPTARGFLCTGSWIIPGLELDDPVLSESAFRIQSANELSVDGRIRYLQNQPGFSLLEHCRETWRERDDTYEYEPLFEAARDTRPFRSLVDPIHQLFFDGQSDGDVIEKIHSYCRQTDQPIPETEGEITRCLLESHAVRVGLSLELLMAAAETYTDRVHLVGGGVKNHLFCQMVASATGVPVKAGPVEATALGNVISQMVTGGGLDSYEDGRELIDETVEFTHYDPQNTTAWTEALERLMEYVETMDESI